MSPRRLCLVVLVLLLLWLPNAGAHGDARGAETQVSIQPGTSWSFEAQVHYHRLVGHVDSLQGEAPLRVEVTGPSGVPQVVAGPGQALRVNALIACCRDEVWQAHTVTVHNVGTVPADVAVDLTLLHDDFAVVAQDAEPGAAWQTTVIALLLTGVPAVLAHRRATPDAARTEHWLRIGGASLLLAWLVVGLVSVVGMLRYGGGPLVGLRAGLAGVAVFGDFVDSMMLLALPTTVLWTLGLVGWVVAERRAAAEQVAMGRTLALAAAVGPLAFGVLLALEYGGTGVALLAGALPAVIILGSVWLARHRSGSAASAPT